MKHDPGFIVVGAKGHIGSFLFASLRAKGHKVLGVDVATSVSSIDDVAVCDFSSPGAVRHYLDETCSTLDPAQLVIILAQGLIHNEAAVKVEGDQLVTHQEESWDEVIRSNLKTTFVGATEFARMCRERRKSGVIIAVSSISAGGAVGQIAYSAAKGGIESLVKAINRELGPAGIRAVSISPGYIDTPSTRQHVSESRIEKIVQQTPVRRLGTPNEILSTIEWIVATEFVSGTTVEITGGLTL